ncbi:MAG: hypothetical protein MUP15_03455 [Dehalococcoidia bacterium]|nr:hypothetical protein [Dehalococcoidia bacterium]
MSADNRLAVNVQAAREVGNTLRQSFNDPSIGILGHTTMPEDILPGGMTKGSYEHLMFTTLTVSLDYMRDAVALWAASRHAYEDETSRYLFSPQRVVQSPSGAVSRDLQRHGVSLRPDQDAHIWNSVSLTFLTKWGGNPMNMLEAARYDAPSVLQMVQSEVGFPYLRGPKISALWVRMLRDNVGIAFKNMGKIPIPTDIHIVRATLSTGVLRGNYSGSLDGVRPYVQEAWADGLAGTKLIPLDVDEPLWNLSRYGCTRRTGGLCPAARACAVSAHCVAGVVRVSTGGVEVHT